MEGQYNKRSPAVKRLMREAHELSEATSQYFAQPLEDNLFEWHFTVRGPADSDFEGGIYHGRIVLPTEYPMKPPNIIVLTPNGRFEVGKKICLSISGHHPESWQPSWSIRTALLAIIGFMPSPSQGTIGSLDYTTDERKNLARKSNHFYCERCGETARLLKSVDEEKEDSSIAADTQAEVREIVKTMAFKGEEEVQEEKKIWNSQQATPSSDIPVAKDDDQDMDDVARQEILARKRASQAAQQRFRDRLQLRTTSLSAQIAAVQQTSVNPSLNNPEGSQQQQPQHVQNTRAGGGSWSLTDYLIFALVLAIALIIYRRLDGFVGESSDA